MQQNEILNLTRENYKVPSGEEKYVHYKLAIVKDGVAKKVRIVKSDEKLFSAIIRNYELSGYTIEILYHPQGKYTSVTIPKPVEVIISEKDAEIARLTERIKSEGTDFILKKKDDEIENLNKRLEEMEAKLKESEEKLGANKENADEKEGETNDSPENPEQKNEKEEEKSKETKKTGRPKKS